MNYWSDLLNSAYGVGADMDIVDGTHNPTPTQSAYVPLSLRNLYADIRSVEEFYAADVAPVFDELEEIDWNLGNLYIATTEDFVYKGRIFKNKRECQMTLAIYAIKQIFYFKQTISTPKKVVCACVDPKFHFYVYTTGVPNSDYLEIRKAGLEHNCDIISHAQYTKHATTKVIAKLMKSEYVNGALGPRACELSIMVL